MRPNFSILIDVTDCNDLVALFYKKDKVKYMGKEVEVNLGEFKAADLLREWLLNSTTDHIILDVEVLYGDSYCGYDEERKSLMLSMEELRGAKIGAAELVKSTAMMAATELCKTSGILETYGTENLLAPRLSEELDYELYLGKYARFSPRACT